MLETDFGAARRWWAAAILIACLAGCSPKTTRDPAALASTGADALRSAKDLYGVATSNEAATTDMGRAYEARLAKARELEQQFEERFRPLYAPMNDPALRTQPQKVKQALAMMDHWPKAGSQMVDKHIENFDELLADFSRISGVPLEEVKARPALAATRAAYEEYRKLLAVDSKSALAALRKLYEFWLANPKGATTPALFDRQTRLLAAFGEAGEAYGKKDVEFKKRNAELMKGAVDNLKTQLEK